MKLKKVTINKYKSIQKPQEVEIDPSITTLVGMNESGKTSFLTAIAKTNYFIKDADFEFDQTQDFPRKELIDFENSEEDCKIITCDYEISEELLNLIENELGKDVLTNKDFSYTCHYKNDDTFKNINCNLVQFWDQKLKKYDISEATKNTIKQLKFLNELSTITKTEEDIEFSELEQDIRNIISKGYDLKNWNNELDAYVAKEWINPNMPKFWYFDDYYPLPGKININNLSRASSITEKDKTSKALFELARIKPEEILNSDENSYEKYIALLEASSNKITTEIFKYWSTNQNLDIEFKIQEITNQNNQREKLLDIRVKNQRHKITLPLDRRSKGFNWFFSFIVWFSKIQADKSSDYILLLDEPGLNLHASAQSDLLLFIEELSKKYQIIYTTHSPFMVDPNKLNRVRTCLETDEGTTISDSIKEKDPNTLFPLQAALGYDIAQNLFINKNNLLVEGPSDLIYLTLISNILEIENRNFLKNDITIMPVGGLDKVSTFISLLRGQKLNIACILDSFTDQKGKQRVEDLITHKIIKEKNIRFFDEFSNNEKRTADIEDLFSKPDYLKFFNSTFKDELGEIKISDLDNTQDTIIKQITKHIGKKFNHYRPANKLNTLGADSKYFSKETLDNFEKLFIEINKLF